MDGNSFSNDAKLIFSKNQEIGGEESLESRFKSYICIFESTTPISGVQASKYLSVKSTKQQISDYEATNVCVALPSSLGNIHNKM